MALESKLSAEVLDKYFAIKSIEEEEDWSTEKFRAAFKKALTHVRTVKEVQYSVRKQKAGERIISLTTTTNKNTNNNWYGNNQNRNFTQFRPSNNRNFSPNREKFRDKNYSPNRENYNRDKSRSFSPSSEEEKRNNQYRKRRDSPFPDRGKSSSDSQSRSREREIICALCSKNHTEVDCTKYKSAEERRNACLKKELCFYCLFKGHMASQCRRRRACLFCRKAHHSALCRKKYGNIREKVKKL
uniref:CCHC-type domain-containing protein n=1 Tax=Meloidogyne incognita TaxID=6306 RepID=A0A914N6C2_MELIC